ncbi:MAG: DUF6647 family protein [Burkholderiales bacterium]
MDKSALMELAQALLLTIGALTGKPMPETLPEIRILPAAVMQERACRDPCRIKAFYIPHEGVYLSDALNIKNDVHAKSILLHELMHFVQNARGSFDPGGIDCDRWYDQEMEAYEVQNAFLRRYGEQRLMWVDRLPKDLCRNRVEQESGDAKAPK